MKHRFLLRSALCFLLLLLVVVYLGRVLSHGSGWQVDPGGRQASTLAPATVDLLKNLPRNLSITFFVSARDDMPSHLKEVERSVRDLLEALRLQAPQRLDYRILDPDLSGPAGAAYAARKKASSFQVRRILQDKHDQQQIWSSLVLAYEGFPEVLIQGIENAHLPYLEELIVQNLLALEQPPRPRFALAGGPTFQLLSHFLSQYGQVDQIDLENSADLPTEADVLFWMQPLRISPKHSRQLQRFVDSGRSVILGGSTYTVSYDLTTEPARYRTRPLGAAWKKLLAPLGLVAQPDLLMDRNAGPVLLAGDDGSARPVEAPFHLRCLPAFYNMKSFLGAARGGLNFVAASALEINPRKVEAAGFNAEIVGTTTEHAWVRALPNRTFANADLDPTLQVGKQNLMVLLKTDDPWKGQILVLASAAPFQDGIINQPGYAHQVFLKTLVRTFAAPQRLVRIRVERTGPDQIPPLGHSARLGWRFFAVFLVPLLLLALGLWRYAASGGQWPDSGNARWLLWRLGAVLLALFAAPQLLGLTGALYLDLTRDELHTLAPQTRELLERRRGNLQAELAITSRASLPLGLKDAEQRIQDLLERGSIPSYTRRPEYLTAREQQLLQGRGLQPFAIQQVVSDTLVSRQVWSALQLRQGEHTAVIPRLDVNTLEHLEFLLAAALQRLDQGRAPHLAVISDLPRLSPAEALEDFHKKGLLPPGGADVYSRLKTLLRDYGYRISYINPREPYWPDAVDVLLWLQPRRDSSPLLLLLARHLHHGGKAIVALQHFNIQQRQYRGTGFATVYWPQPQFQDLDPYLRLFGVEQIREVLMDRTQSHLELETQVNRTAVREYDPQKVALPFLIRAVGAHFSSTSALTRHLGDLLFIWGNRFALDPVRLQAAGLAYQPLINTSSKAWSFAWKGGWLPPEILQSATYLEGEQPLALALQGPFPAVEFQEDAEGRKQLVVQTNAFPPPAGELVLIGCSEMFKNDYLHAAPFQHDQLLLNAVALLAYGPELGALQARRKSTRGFAFSPTTTRAAWRIFVIATGPLTVLLYGLWRFARRQHPPRMA